MNPGFVSSHTVDETLLSHKTKKVMIQDLIRRTADLEQRLLSNYCFTISVCYVMK
jgi:hypothetical protein